MKKWIAVLVAASLLAFGGSAYASVGPGTDMHDQKSQEAYKGKGNGKGKSKIKGEHGKTEDDIHEHACKRVPPGLERALSKVENERARAALKDAIQKQKQKCKNVHDEDDDRDDNHDNDLTAWQRVSADYESLRIGYASGDSSSSVTKNVALKTTGVNGSAIVWQTSNSDVITASGIVKPTTVDAVVKLTAVISYGKASAIRAFTVTVRAAAPKMTDAERVAKDTAALVPTFASGDSAANVTRPLKELPAKGENGSSILWYSTAPSILSADGRTVNRPAAGSGDATVVLTAVITYGSAADTKLFPLTVKQQLTDAQKVAADTASLALDYGGSDTAARVTRPLDRVPVTGDNGSSITWISSHPHVLSIDGKVVNRPPYGTADAVVVLTAILTSNGYSDTKSFTITVRADYNTYERIAADKADLAIGYAQGDAAGSVTKPITLPASGYYGSSVIWYSSHPQILSDDGRIVNRPAIGQDDVTVTMMAYLTLNGVGDLRTFTLTVKAHR
jgi:hypothetical protein